MNVIFIPTGPYKIPVYQGKASRIITENEEKMFWNKYSAIGKQRGCYVFGIRAGGGLTPGYVGRATKSFKQEVFTHHKLSKYHQFLADYQRGTPVLFFLSYPVMKGAPKVSHIQELEDFLIQACVKVNPGLLNIKGTKAEEWGISGVLRGATGKPSKSARSFKILIKMK